MSELARILDCSKLLLRRAFKLEVGGKRILCQVASGIVEALNSFKVQKYWPSPRILSKD